MVNRKWPCSSFTKSLPGACSVPTRHEISFEQRMLIYQQPRFMPTPVDEQAHLRAADDRLRLAVFLLSAQEERIAQEMVAGLNTQLSGELFLTMQSILRSFIAHRQAILNAIDDDQRALQSLSGR